MKRLQTYTYLLFALLLLLPACANLGAPAPTSIGQELYYAESTYIAAIQSLDNAVLAGTITKAQAQQAQVLADQVDATLSAARIANSSGNTATAQSQLAAANSAILALQQYLAAQGVKPK